MSKRIAILANFPWSFFDHGVTGRGGGQACTWLAQLAEEFVHSCPYEVHWVSIDRKMPGIRSVVKEWGGQYFHRIPGIRSSLDLRLDYRLSRWQLLRLLKKIGADVVHCWGTETAYPIVCGACGVPSILSMQGILSEYARIESLPDMYYWKRLVALEPQFLQAATVVTCESKWGIDRVKEVKPKVKIYQVEYGVHSFFYDTPWQPNQELPYLLYCGGMDWRKGVDVLMDALTLIPDRKWTLRLAGEGELFLKYASLNLPRVEWLGNLNWEELRTQMAGAWGLVMPTRADTGPSIVKEALVIGLPVIGSIHGGLRDYIQPGENGMLVEPLQPKILAAVMNEFMSDYKRLRIMGRARHAEDRAYFRPSETARGFLAIYDELTQQTRPR